MFDESFRSCLVYPQFSCRAFVRLRTAMKTYPEHTFLMRLFCMVDLVKVLTDAFLEV